MKINSIVTIVVLIAAGIGVSFAVCMIEKDGGRCNPDSAQALPSNGCVNYMYTPLKKLCEAGDDEGSYTCNADVLPCIKKWQQQVLYQAGTGPYPEHTEPYCANPGDWQTGPGPHENFLQSWPHNNPCPPSG